MSTASLGGARVGKIITQLHALSFHCARLSASGQRRGKRRLENGLAGDIIALAPQHSGLPHLLAEVGGAGKRIAVAFAELREGMPPGFAPLVVVFRNRKCFYYPDEDVRHDALREALEWMVQ